MTAVDATGADGVTIRASLIVLNYEGLDVLMSVTDHCVRLTH